MKIKVKRLKLIDQIESNLKKHKKIYKEALIGYKEKNVAMLKKYVEKIEKGEIIKAGYIHIETPENHISEYERVISMLQMDVRLEFELTEEEYVKFVLDQWEWKERWASNTMSYARFSEEEN